MARFDRYMLSQLMILFGFFALILVAIYWINSAVRLFDTIVGGGQSALVFLEFSALTLPNVIRVVLPVAAFVASVYVTNRLTSESELAVMQATGFSPWRLARPVALFGLVATIMTAVLTIVLVPMSRSYLDQRHSEIAQDVTSGLITEGQFLHPSDGITFYIGDITADGELQNVFLSDRRNPNSAVTYTASKAYLARAETGAMLIMVTGKSQTYDIATQRLLTTDFSDLSYDISTLVQQASTSTENVSHMTTRDLLSNPTGVAERTNTSLAMVSEELHTRFERPLLALVAALIGFSTLLTRSYSRMGIMQQVFAAIMLLVLIKLIEGRATEFALSNHTYWPIIYTPVVVGLLIVGIQIWWVSRPKRVLTIGAS